MVAYPITPAWVPSDSGLIAATHDPALSEVSGQAVNGRLYVFRLVNRNAGSVTVSNLWFQQQGTAGAGPSTGTFVGLYSAAGARLTGSADVASAFTAGLQSPIGPLPVTTPQVFAPNQAFYAAVLFNLVTVPALFGASDDGTIVNVANVKGSQASVSPAAYRYGAIVSVGTSLPASFTPASDVTFFTPAMWCGVS